MAIVHGRNTADALEIASSSDDSWRKRKTLHDLTELNHEFDGLVTTSDIRVVLDLFHYQIFDRLLRQENLSCFAVEAEDERNDVSAVVVDERVYEPGALVVDVPGHDCVFEKLETIIDMDLFLNVKL